MQKIDLNKMEMPKIELLVKLGLQLNSVNMQKIDFYDMEMPKIELLVKLGFQPSSYQLKDLIYRRSNQNLSYVLIDTCINF